MRKGIVVVTHVVSTKIGVSAKHGPWTVDWTHGLDCGLTFGLARRVDDDHYQMTNAHAYITSPSPLVHVLGERFVMDKSRPIVISSDSESDYEVVIATYDLSFTPTKIKR